MRDGGAVRCWLSPGLWSEVGLAEFVHRGMPRLRLVAKRDRLRGIEMTTIGNLPDEYDT